MSDRKGRGRPPRDPESVARERMKRLEEQLRRRAHARRQGDPPHSDATVDDEDEDELEATAMLSVDDILGETNGRNVPAPAPPPPQRRPPSPPARRSAPPQVEEPDERTLMVGDNEYADAIRKLQGGGEAEDLDERTMVAQDSYDHDPTEPEDHYRAGPPEGWGHPAPAAGGYPDDDFADVPRRRAAPSGGYPESDGYAPAEDALHDQRTVMAPQMAEPDEQMPPEQRKGVLTVLMGPDEGQRFLLGDGVTYVGRSLECQVVLKDASASRKHFRIEASDGRYVLVDLGSENGTCVNGVRVDRLPLEPDGQISVGTTLLHFGYLGGAAPTVGATEEVDDDEPRRGGAGKAIALALVAVVLLGGGALVAGELVFGWWSFLGMAPTPVASHVPGEETLEALAAASRAAAEAGRSGLEGDEDDPGTEDGDRKDPTDGDETDPTGGDEKPPAAVDEPDAGSTAKDDEPDAGAAAEATGEDAGESESADVAAAVVAAAEDAGSGVESDAAGSTDDASVVAETETDAGEAADATAVAAAEADAGAEETGDTGAVASADEDVAPVDAGTAIAKAEEDAGSAEEPADAGTAVAAVEADAGTEEAQDAATAKTEEPDAGAVAKAEADAGAKGEDAGTSVVAEGPGPDKLLLEAKALLGDKKLDEAQEKLQAAQQAGAPLDAVKPLIGLIGAARGHQGIVKTLRASLEKGRFQIVLKLAPRIPEESPYASEAAELMTKAREGLVKPKLVEAAKLADEGKKDAALKLVDEVLKLSPEHADAKALQKKIASPAPVPETPKDPEPTVPTSVEHDKEEAVHRLVEDFLALVIAKKDDDAKKLLLAESECRVVPQRQQEQCQKDTKAMAGQLERLRTEVMKGRALDELEDPGKQDSSEEWGKLPVWSVEAKLKGGGEVAFLVVEIKKDELRLVYPVEHPEEPAAAAKLNTRRGLGMYNSGDFAGAQRYFLKAARDTTYPAAERKRAAAMARNIKKFEASYEAGMAAANARKAASATGPLSSALGLDLRLGRHYQRKIKKTLAAMYLERAQSALSSGRIWDAARSARKALKLDRSQAKAKTVLEKVEPKLKALIASATAAAKAGNKSEAKRLLVKAKLTLGNQDPRRAKVLKMLEQLK